MVKHIATQRDRPELRNGAQVAFMGVVLLLIHLVWVRIAGLLFAVFFGLGFSSGLADLPFYNEDIDVEGSVPQAAADFRAAIAAADAVLVVTPEHLVPTGLAEDLDEAVQHCVRAAIELLHARYDMDRPNALAYLSAATDFRISQVVDLVKGVHAPIRIADFE